MHSTAPLQQTDSEFFEFPARAYLEKYYSHVGDENTAILRSILDTPSLSPAGESVIEVGGGPSLFSLMAIAARAERPFRRVTFTDVGWKNLREVDTWLRDAPHQFDYRPLLTWLREEARVDPDQVVARLRASRWELAHFDWRRPVPAAWERAYDVVSSHFFAESATSSEAELLDFLGKVARLGVDGATVLLSFMCRSKGYTIGDQDFPAFSLDESNALGIIERAGLTLRDTVMRTEPTEDPSTKPGYDGMVLIGGRLDLGGVEHEPARRRRRTRLRGRRLKGRRHQPAAGVERERLG